MESCPPCGPRCWGPLQWQTLHQLLRGFEPTPDKRQALEAYVGALVHLLPCDTCAQHWSSLSRTVDTSSRTAALKWSIDAHNAVNARLGKPVLTYAEAVEAITRVCPDNTYRPPCGSGKITALNITVGVLAITVAAFVVGVIVLATRNRGPVRSATTIGPPQLTSFRTE